MSATSVLIATLARTDNRIDDTIRLLQQQRGPEAHSATRILRRLQRVHPGAVRAYHVGRGFFKPGEIVLTLHYINEKNTVIATEPWNGPATIGALEAYFTQHTPAGARHVRLVNEEQTTLLVAPPIRGGPMQLAS